MVCLLKPPLLTYFSLMEIPSAKKSCLSDDEKHNDTIYLFKAEQSGFRLLTLGEVGRPLKRGLLLFRRYKVNDENRLVLSHKRIADGAFTVRIRLNTGFLIYSRVNRVYGVMRLLF